MAGSSAGDGRGMKVAMVCPQVPPVYGGAGTQAVALSACLAKNECSVEVYTGNQSWTSRVTQSDGVTIRRAPGEGLVKCLPGRLAEIARTAIFSAWLAVMLTARKHDVYHLHGNYWYALAPALIARLRKVPCVVKVTRLDDDDAQTTSQKRLGILPVGRIYALPMRLASVVVAVNREIGARHMRTFPHVPMLCMPNGVDESKFIKAMARREQVRLDFGISESVVVLFVGQISERKGVGNLLDAWQLLLRSEGDKVRPLCLLLVGPSDGDGGEGSSEISARVATESKQSTESDTSIKHLAPRQPHEMPELYAGADIFVLPTQSEGMPNSLLEALATGLSVVVSHVPGVTEILETVPHTGAILSSSSVEEIARGLRAAIESADLEERELCVSRLPRQYTLENVADCYLRLYRQIGTAGRREAPEVVRHEVERLSRAW
jgi:glycosyltransferase involved in cell wall biosynthesis